MLFVIWSSFPGALESIIANPAAIVALKLSSAVLRNLPGTCGAIQPLGALSIPIRQLETAALVSTGVMSAAVSRYAFVVFFTTLWTSCGRFALRCKVSFEKPRKSTLSPRRSFGDGRWSGLLRSGSDIGLALSTDFGGLPLHIELVYLVKKEMNIPSFFITQPHVVTELRNLAVRYVANASVKCHAAGT